MPIPHTHSQSPVQERVICKKCGSDDCFRIRRSTLTKALLGFLALKHYRCAKCKRTFYKF